ncbi:MAG: hypothetical protein HY216_05205 [Candidatus Rokubacteria bacterium]|nr:hypothetical protein [Candidatus Rokubacteria bacterium]
MKVPPHRARFWRCGEKELEVGIREDDGSGISALKNDIPVYGEVALKRSDRIAKAAVLCDEWDERLDRGSSYTGADLLVADKKTNGAFRIVCVTKIRRKHHTYDGVDRCISDSLNRGDPDSLKQPRGSSIQSTRIYVGETEASG